MMMMIAADAEDGWIVIKKKCQRLFEQSFPSPSELRLDALALFEIPGFYPVAKRN